MISKSLKKFFSITRTNFFTAGQNNIITHFCNFQIIHKNPSKFSGRQRKKYIDDVQFNLSDDESSFQALPPEAQAAAKAGREADKAAEAEAAAAKEGGRSSGRTSGRTTPNRASERASGDDLEDSRAPPPSSEDASAEVTQSGPNYAYVVSTYLLNCFW